jgi:hypothetical protein
VHYNRLKPFAGPRDETVVEEVVDKDTPKVGSKVDGLKRPPAKVDTEVRSGLWVPAVPPGPVPVEGGASDADETVSMEDGDSVNGGGEESAEGDNQGEGSTSPSSSSEDEEEMGQDTWNQQRTRSGRATQRPARLRDYHL